MFAKGKSITFILIVGGLFSLYLSTPLVPEDTYIPKITPTFSCNTSQENPLSQVPVISTEKVSDKDIKFWQLRALQSPNTNNVFGKYVFLLKKPRQSFGFVQKLATGHTLFTIVMEYPQDYLLVYREVQPVFYKPSTKGIGWEFIFRNESLLFTKGAKNLDLQAWSVNSQLVQFKIPSKKNSSVLQTCQCIDFINGPWEMWTSNCLSYDWGCLIDCGLNSCFWCAGYCAACASSGSYCGSCIACALGCSWCSTRCCASWWSGCVDCGAP